MSYVICHMSYDTYIGATQLGLSPGCQVDGGGLGGFWDGSVGRVGSGGEGDVAAGLGPEVSAAESTNKMGRGLDNPGLILYLPTLLLTL